MITVLWIIAIVIGGLTYVLYKHFHEAKRTAEVHQERTERLLERVAKAMESIQQIQQDRREDELLKDDDDPYARETPVERERRWASYQKK